MKFTKETMKQACFLLLFLAFLVLCLVKIDEIFAFSNKFISIISPIIIGGCVAFVINIPMRKIEGFLSKHLKRKGGYIRIVSLILALVFVFAVIALVLVLVIPQLVKSISTLIPQIQPFITEVSDWVLEKFNDPYIAGLLEGLEIDWIAINESFNGILRNGLMNIFTGVFSFARILVNFIVGIVFAVYILASKEKFARQIKKVMRAFLPKRKNEIALEVLSMCNETFGKFITGQCLEAVILGSIFFVVMTLIRMPYALLIGVLISVTALVPIVGAFVGCIVGAFLILIESPMQAVLFVVIFLVIQQIEGNVIYPKVVGDSVGIPAILMLLAIVIGGGLWGIAGMLFFIPVVAVAYNLLRAVTNKKVKEKEAKEKFEVEE